MNQGKLKVIKNFEKLDVSIQEMVKKAFPFGFAEDLLSISNKEGALIKVLPFETDDTYFLIKFPSGNTTFIDADDVYDDTVVKSTKADVKKDLEEDFDAEDTDVESVYNDEPDIDD